MGGGVSSGTAGGFLTKPEAESSLASTRLSDDCYRCVYAEIGGQTVASILQKEGSFCDTERVDVATDFAISPHDIPCGLAAVAVRHLGDNTSLLRA